MGEYLLYTYKRIDEWTDGEIVGGIVRMVVREK
jgi:hypothetical protein